MNKSVMIGILGLIAGLLLIGIGFLIVRGDWTKFNGRNGASKYEKSEYVCSGNIDEIEIGEHSENIEIKIGSVDKPVIEYWYREGEKDEVEITEKNGKLSFKREDNKKLKVVFFSMNFEDTSTVVTLPEDYDGSILATATSGRVLASGVNSRKDITLKANSGYVCAENIKADNLTMKATSGSIKVNDSECEGRFDVENNSGYITVERFSAGNDISSKNTSGYAKFTDVSCNDFSAQNSSGGIGITKITCNDLSAKATSGSVKITNAECRKLKGECNSGSLSLTSVNAESIDGQTTSGGLRIDGIAADDIVLSSKSGGVRGSIKGSKSDYSIICSTGSGSSNLDSKRDGDKSLDVTTTSGSVKITFDK